MGSKVVFRYLLPSGYCNKTITIFKTSTSKRNQCVERLISAGRTPELLCILSGQDTAYRAVFLIFWLIIKLKK